MWQETVIRLICFSLCGGLAYGIVVDAFFVVSYFFAKSFRTIGKRTRSILVAILDAILGVIAGSIVLLVLYYGNSGRFRVSSLVFFMLSYVAYRLSVSKLFRIVAGRSIDVFLSLVEKIFDIVKKAWNFFLNRTRKIIETYKNKRRLRIEKHKDNKLGHNKKCGKRAVYRGKSRVAGECEKCT